MKLNVKKINFETGNVKVAVLNLKDAEKIGKKAGDRIILQSLSSKEDKRLIAILDVSYHDSIVAPGEVGIFIDTFINLKDFEITDTISVLPAEPPDSFKYIKRKIKGKKLTSEEINSIISDAVSGRLSQIDLAAFITGVSINGMDKEEMTALTFAEARSGTIFDFGPDVYDKHSTKIHS